MTVRHQGCLSTPPLQPFYPLEYDRQKDLERRKEPISRARFAATIEKLKKAMWQSFRGK